jgi:tetrathionate reductase subunit C
VEGIRVVYNIPYQVPFSMMIAIYFYITGLHMGFYTTSVVATLLDKREWKPIGKIGAVGAVIILCIAPIFLLLDLTQPFRFWHLFVHLNATSPITWGTYFLTTYPLIGLFYAYFVLAGRQRPAKILGLIGFPIAVSVHGYTGFILALGKARALWNASINPILFLVSAMVSGLALIVIIANVRYRYLTKNETPEQREADFKIIRTMLTMLIVFILIDLVLLGSDVAVLGNSDVDSWEQLKVLTVGEFGFLFLVVEILMGELIPLGLLSSRRIRESFWGINIIAILIMVGIFAMRVVIVKGGQHIPLH